MRLRRFIGSATAVAAAALTCGMTATTALAATANKAAPAVTPNVTTVTWHKLSLQNGWKSDRSTTYPVADPSYAVSSGIIYLDGTLHQPTGTNKQFGVLPLGYRPAHTLYLTVSTGSNSTPGAVEIKTNGVMTAYSPTGTSRTLTSLSAVSFPAAGAHWTNLTLVNGWKSGAAAFSTSSPAYTVRSGIVYLAGSTFTNSSPNLQATTLPTNARPMSQLYITVYNKGGLAGWLNIYPDGTLQVRGSAAALHTALDGVSFPTAAAALTWHPLTLATGWSSGKTYGTGDPEYAVKGPIVYFAGSLVFNTGSGGSEVFAALPTVAQTPHWVTRQVYTYSGSTGEFAVAVGKGIMDSNPMSHSQTFSSLAGIAYPRNS